MAKKSFKSLPKRAKKAAFAQMEKDGKAWPKHPITGKRIGATKAQIEKRKAGLVELSKRGVGSATALLMSLKRK